MNHLLEFGKRVQEKDEAGFPMTDEKGQPVYTFNVFKRAYPIVNTTFGQEKYQAKQIYNEVIVRFTIPYISGITSEMLIRFRGEIFEIIEPPDNVKFENKKLKIEAKRVILWE